MVKSSALLPSVFIVVPVFNRAEVTKAFVASVHRQTYGDIRLYVVDDASPDGTAAILRGTYPDWERLIVLDSGGNAWWGGGVHIGMTEALKRAQSHDCVLLMNDDVDFGRDLVERLVQAHKEQPNAVLSAVSVQDGQVVAAGSNMIFWPLAVTSRPFGSHKWPSSDLPAYIPVHFQPARATLYPVRMLNDIGGIEYIKLPHYHGDGELSWRAIKNGYKSFVVSSVPVYPRMKSTGLFNSKETKYSWTDFMSSFTHIKSINNVRYRWQFAKLTCPPIWRYPYFLSCVLISALKSALLLLKTPKSSM